LFRFVPQQFFPASTRLELMVDMKLAEGASLNATAAQAKKLEAMLAKQQGVETTSPTSAPVRRASTCRWTSNCRRRVSPSSCCSPTTSNRAKRCASG
jgi:multidrug efflux pump subunit AcrB